MEEVNIGVDVLSYAQNIWDVSDYAGEQIYSKLALPLFRYNGKEIVLSALDSFVQEHSYLELKLRDNLFWSNGEKVTSMDYIRSIKHIMDSVDNCYYNLLSSVKAHPRGITYIDDYSFSIYTAWFDPFIINYLTLLNFSPMHRSNKYLHAGPYEILHADDRIFRLRPNEFFVCTEGKDWVRSVNYIWIAEDFEGESFHSGRVHVSCDTSLDLRYYSKNQQDSNFFPGQTILAMLLSPGDKFYTIPLSVLEVIGVVVDRVKISHNYAQMLEPLFSWMALYGQNYEEVQLLKREPLEHPVYLDVAFEDFYPNKEILELIAAQLGPFNIFLSLKEDQYGCRDHSCHLRFEIRKIPEGTPIQLIRSDVSKVSREAHYFEAIKAKYTALYDIKNQHKRHEIFSDIDFILRKYLLYIPLFVFPTGYFCRPYIDASSILASGSRIFYNRLLK